MDNKEISTNKLYELQNKEDRTKFPKSLDLSYDRFSYEVLKNREFYFSLGFCDDGTLRLNGNCYTWSNAFSFDNPSFKLVHEIINLHEKISKDILKQIIIECKGNKNKLFFCKEDTHMHGFNKHYKLPEKVLSWHYFPEPNDYNNCIEQVYTGKINDLEFL